MPTPAHAVHYLEVVTPDLQAAADFDATAYGWQLEPAAPELGGIQPGPWQDTT
jgi:hypothetical protein